MIVSNVEVYNLDKAVAASKYPYSIDIDKCSPCITDTTFKLASSPKGEGHDTFLNGIIVSFDLTFTVKAWTEAERYHFLEFISSQSTMHKLADFDLEFQYSPYTDKRMIEIMKELQAKYKETKSDEDFLKLVYSNPCGFKLTAKMVTNYRQLKTIYSQRKNHRLPEWREFCKRIENLPFFKLLCLPDEFRKELEEAED